MREGTLLLVAGIFFVFIRWVQRFRWLTLRVLDRIIFWWWITVTGHQFAHGISFAWLRKISPRIVRAVLDQGQLVDLLAQALAFLRASGYAQSIAGPTGRQP